MAWHSLVSSVFLLSITNVACHPLHSDDHSPQRMPMPMPMTTPTPWKGDEKQPPVEQTPSFDNMFGDLFLIQSDYKEGDPEPYQRMTQIVVSGRMIYTRTSTGPVAIAENQPEGMFIVLENTGSGLSRESVNLTNWTLQNKVADKPLQVYTFKDVVIQPGKQLKIWAVDFAHNRSPNDLVAHAINNWGVGSYVITTLLNEDNEEKARLTRKKNYSSDS